MATVSKRFGKNFYTKSSTEQDYNEASYVRDFWRAIGMPAECCGKHVYIRPQDKETIGRF